ncbi:MAG: UbiA prenyltransferase family protein [Microgenomates group bacterium]
MFRLFQKTLLYQLLFLLRPWHWVKNIAVYVPIVFAGLLFTSAAFWQTTIAFLSLCFLSSSHYIINDIVDAPKDKLDSNRKHRPIASSAISVELAWFVWCVCVGIGFFIASQLGSSFFIVALTYSFVHYLLLFIFRHMPILDIMALATGYILRIFAGEVASDIHISIWLALSAFSLALLFAVSKRRHEWNMKQATVVKERYSERLLDTYIAVFATSSFLSYTYFTFLSTFSLEGVTGAGRKWLMITTPFVLYGILRFLQQLYEEKQKTFQRLLVTDAPLLITAFGWGISVLVIIYGLR